MPFEYYNADRTKKITSPRKLTPDELAHVFTKPLSQDPKAEAKAKAFNFDANKEVQKRVGLAPVRRELSAPAGRAGASETVADVLRIGGAIGGSAIGHPFLGGAAGDVAAQGVQMLAGTRGGYSPMSTVKEAALAGFVPGMEGGIVAGAVKGGLYGAASTTINSVLQGQEVPTVGRLAFSTLAGASMVAGGRRLLRSPVYELSGADVGQEVHNILSGDPLSKAALTPAVKEEVRDLQLKLPDVKFRPSPLKLGPTYRKVSGRFGSTAKLFEGAGGAKETAEQFPLEFPLATAGPSPRYRGDIGQLRIGITKGHFGRVERSTGIPVYSEMFDPIEQANTRAIDFNNARMGEAQDALRGVGRVHREKYQAYLEMPDKTQAANVLKFERGDHIRAEGLRKSWDRMFMAYGLEDQAGPNGMSRADEYLTRHLPRLRQARFALSQTNPEPSGIEVLNEAFPVGVPKSVAFFKEGYIGEGMSPGDINSEEILAKHLRHGSYKTWLEQHVTNAEKRFVFNPNLPPGLKATAKWYLGQIKGADDPTGRDLGIFISKFAGRFGYKISPRESRAVANTFLHAGQYGSTLGFRPGPLFRNFLQTWQTGFSELGHYWFVGERAARTSTGRALAHQLGLFGGDPGLAQEVLAGAENIPSTLVGKTARAFSKFTEKSLARYSSVDEMNRTIMGLGQYARAMKAMRKANGNVNKFIDYAWLDSGVFQPGERAVLKQLAVDGNWMEAARRSAIGLADNTQWVYRAGNRAPITSGTAGRMATGFYTWGSFYANYLRRMHTPTGFMEQPGKQALRLARFYAANGAVIGIGSAIGSAAGVEDGWKRMLTWNLFSPAVYTGGPILKEGWEVMQGLNELAQGDLTGPHEKAAVRGLSTFIPGYGLANDFKHLAEPDKGEGEAALRVMGVLPRKAP